MSQIQQKNKKILDQGIQGASLMGRTYTIIGSIIMTTISVFIIIGGIMILRSPYKKFVEAKVTASQCDYVGSSDSYKCNLTFKYAVDGKEYTKTVSYDSYYEIQVDDIIDIYVNPDSPEDYQFYKLPDWIGTTLIVIGSLMIFFSLLYLFFILRYKALAVLSGIKNTVA